MRLSAFQCGETARRDPGRPLVGKRIDEGMITKIGLKLLDLAARLADLQTAEGKSFYHLDMAGLNRKEVVQPGDERLEREPCATL